VDLPITQFEFFHWIMMDFLPNCQ